MKNKKLKKYIFYSLILISLSLLYIISIIDNCFLLLTSLLLLIIFESIEKDKDILIFDIIWMILIYILYFINI